jgi:MGT family glycosyltransferase
MLAIACDLRDRGYTILFNTAEVFRKQVESKGIRFVPLTGRANFDYRTFNKFIPEGKTLTPGPEEMNHNLQHVFGDTMLDQCEGLKDIISRESVDLIVTDFLFMGIFPLLLGPDTDRPPIISVGVTPVLLSSADASLFAPVTTEDARKRNREHTAKFQASLAPGTEYIDNILRGYGSKPLPGFVFDCLYTMPDLFLQLTADAFEFPRTDMPVHMKYVGPLLTGPSSSFQPPDWWKELDGSKPVVLVTQGTVANVNLNELIGPTILGLSTEKVTVIAATGRPTEELTTPVSSNAIVTSFIPFAEVLPKVDVFVTNGGYGSVNQALGMGVPVVVAGQTEDKSWVSARVAWSGAGISLGTSYPTPEQIREAVREVLKNDTYRAKARILQTNFAEYDALDRINRYVELFLSETQTFEKKPMVSSRPRKSGVGHEAVPI